ncbi:DNA primase [Caldicoprobacter guelmensis]|uniref:DNA primase n=1 Tax=Caldicoprobacter guelmensis TaxID=1170224 RepID=UPI0019562FB7|nr:DNA primase [Caldicoprobacter guelmensis]MBM7581840.1 DNA primase [Caldicoprobacter guelmensis]
MGIFLPDEWIDEVRERNDIVDVISEYVHLKPQGRGFVGLCPFHAEKTPSFHVNPEKQLYHCFGCGVGGNVFTFIMAVEKLEFVEAVKFLAERVGMALPQTTDAEEFIRSKSRTERIYEVNREVARYYHRMLFSPEGGQALSYLKARGLDLNIIRRFGIGYAPDGWENAKQYLLKQGFEEELLIQAGIVVSTKGRTYDRFRNRVIFPIIKPRGLVVGFGGRVLDDSLPKYLNSPESPVFHKGSTLFGLNLVRKASSLDYIIIAEGYMDVVTLHQFGFKTAVASLGTSLTQQQAKVIRRYTQQVYIAYDGDAAGQKATLRGLDILQDAGLKVKVILFPQGMDPDEVLRKYGAEFFKKLMDKAVPLVDYKLDRLRSQYDLQTSEGRARYATEAAKILIQVPNLLERDVHIQRLEAQTGFSSRLLYQQIAQLEGSAQKEGVKRQLIGNNRYIDKMPGGKESMPSHIKAERYLVNLMASSNWLAKKVVEKVEPQYFEEPINREIFNIVVELLNSGKEVSIPQVLSSIQDQDKIQQMVEIFELPVEYDNIDKFISDCIDEIMYHNLEKRRQEVVRLIRQMEQEGKQATDTYRALLSEMAVLTRKVAASRHRKEGIL